MTAIDRGAPASCHAGRRASTSTTRWCSPPAAGAGPAAARRAARRPRRTVSRVPHARRLPADRWPARPARRRAVVLGGGLLGLEAARGLAGRGLRSTVVHAGRPPDGPPARRRRRRACSPRTLAGLGVRAHVGAERRRAWTGSTALRLADGTELRGRPARARLRGAARHRLAARRRARRRPRASSSTTGCAPATRTSTRSATAPSTPAPSTGWSRPAWEQAATVADRLTGGGRGRYRGSRSSPGSRPPASTWPRWVAPTPAPTPRWSASPTRPGARTPAGDPRRPAGRRRSCSATTRRSARSSSSSTADAEVPADRRSLLLGRALGAGPRRPRPSSPGADAGRGRGLPVQHGAARRRSPRAGAAGARTVARRRRGDPGHAPAAAAAGTRSAGIVDWLSTVGAPTTEVRGMRLVVVGNGMVGQRFVEALRARDTGRQLVGHGAGRGAPARLRPGAAVGLLRGRQRGRADPRARPAYRPAWTCGSASRRLAIDRAARVVRTADGRVPVRRAGAGHRVARRSCRRCRAATCPGCFVYRTLDDLEAMRAYAAGPAASAPSSAAGCSGWRRPTRCGCSGLRDLTSSSSRRG